MRQATYLNALFDADIDVLMVLAYGNKIYDGDVAPYTEEGLNAYADYARFMAETFKGKIKAYEIWNEYTTGFGNPQNQPPEMYAEMLKRAYTAIKEADPDAIVLCGGYLHPSTPAFKRIFDVGGFDYGDVMSYQP